MPEGTRTPNLRFRRPILRRYKTPIYQKLQYPSKIYGAIHVFGQTWLDLDVENLLLNYDKQSLKWCGDTENKNRSII